MTITTIVLAGALLAACRSEVLTPTELEAVRTANNSYLAYQRGDCGTVVRLTDPRSLEVWPFNEMRHSTLLLHGFCREIDGDIRGARKIYRQLILEAPNSFASDDATERIRTLRLIEEDPDFISWTRAAKDRADNNRPKRTPIDRVPVEYPPLAKATEIDGYAIVEYGVTGNGGIDNPVIVESNPPFLFDGASLRAVRRWQYMRSPSASTVDRQLIRILFKQGESTTPDAPTPSGSSETQ